MPKTKAKLTETLRTEMLEFADCQLMSNNPGCFVSGMRIRHDRDENLVRVVATVHSPEASETTKLSAPDSELLSLELSHRFSETGLRFDAIVLRCG